MNSCEKASSKLLGLDMFRTPFLFFLPDHKEQYRTCLGATLTLLTLTLTIFYSGYKCFVMLQLVDFKIMEINSQHYYPHTREIGLKDGFKIAAAFTDWTGNPEITEDPEIGTLELYMIHWGGTVYGDTYDFHKLETRLCDPDKDLNDEYGSNASSDFYKVHPVSAYDVKTYGGKMKCITEPYSLMGNYNSESAAYMKVVFDKCDSSKRKCKSESEIESFLRSKYIVTLTNERVFIQHKFGEEKVQAYSKITWYPLATSVRTEYVKEVKTFDVILNDSIFSVGHLLEEESKGFILEDQ